MRSPLVLILCRIFSPSNNLWWFPSNIQSFSPLSEHNSIDGWWYHRDVNKEGQAWSSKAFTCERSKILAKKGRKMMKPLATLPLPQLPPPPSLQLLQLLQLLLLLPPPLPSPLPPPSLSTKSNICSWTNEGTCQFQHEGCSLTIHHICQNVWEDTHNWSLWSIARWCPQHHHGYGTKD